MIHVNALSKVYQVHEKEPGLKGSVKALFRRKLIDKWAVKDVSFDVQPGEIVGLVGANGAGKTTLVKMLSGIVFPTSGTASVLGYTPWERQIPFRHSIALIMGQKAQLWWDLPAGDCFLLLREIYKIPKAEFHANLDFLVSTLEVKDQLKIQIRRLSLGERMKMELIAALLHSPKVVYLDEPTIGLDITSQRAMRKFILAYRKERNPAMILTSHYMEDIEQLCERLIIMRQGGKIYDGPTGEITRKFASSRVVRVQLRFTPDESTPVTPPVLKEGELLSFDGDIVRIKTARDNIPNCIAEALQALPAADLSIEEEDIGNIIESIMRTGVIR